MLCHAIHLGSLNGCTGIGISLLRLRYCHRFHHRVDVFQGVFVCTFHRFHYEALNFEPY